MKKWGAGILSAFLAFAIGLGAVRVRKLFSGLTVRIQTLPEAEKPKAKTPLVPIPKIRKEVSDVMRPHAVRISPYQIRKYVEENKATDLGIKNGYNEYGAKLDDYWEQLGIENNFPDVCHNCEAKIFSLELDEEPGREIMLRLHEEINTSYLIFKPLPAEKDNWQFIGYFNVEGQRYNPPEQRVVRNGAKRWLALKLLWGHGSGYGSSGETLYEITGNGVRPVLSYLTDKYLGAMNETYPTQEIDSDLVKVEVRDGMTRATVQYSLRYTSNQDNGLVLWNKQQTATITESEVDYFDTSASDVSEDEFEDLYMPDTLYGGDKLIMQYYYPELRKIAAGKNERRKDWLRRFLDPQSASEEKSQLKALMR
jgi:hypothetical protein